MIENSFDLKDEATVDRLV